MVEPVNVECPYCGEPLTAPLEQAASGGEHAAECPICFCPILFRVSPVLQGRFHRVVAVRDDEFTRAACRQETADALQAV